MGIFKFLKNLICYISTGFLFSALVKLKTVISQVQEIFSLFFTVITRVHYTQSFSRETNRTCYQLRSIVPYYWVVEILRMNNSIPLSFASIWLYTTCMPPIINHVSDQYSVCFCLHIRGVVVRAHYIGNLRLPSHQVNI